MILTLKNKPVTVTSVHVRDAVSGKERLLRTRLTIETDLSVKQLANLPFGDLTNILTDSKQVDEGDPNTVKLNYKRRWSPMQLSFSHDGAHTEAVGEFKNAVQVRVVEGVPSLRFVVEVLVDPETVGYLAAMVESDHVRLKTGETQLSLPGLEDRNSIGDSAGAPA